MYITVVKSKEKWKKNHLGRKILELKKSAWAGGMCKQKATEKQWQLEKPAKLSKSVFAEPGQENAVG